MSQPSPKPQFRYVEELVRYELSTSLGGVRGILEAAVPFIAFTVVWVVTNDLTWSLVAALAAAAVLAAVRLIQRQSLRFVAQAVKICVDSTLQETVEDDFRGRVFSVYDTLFNLTFVVALVVGAFTLPESGLSWLVPVVVAGGYLLAAVTYARITRAH